MSPQDQTPAPRQHGAMEYSQAPVDLDEVRRYRLDRVRRQLRERDYGGGLFFDQINCRYISDATNMQIWCAHYETRCVYVAGDGPVVLFDYAHHPHLAEGLPGVDEYRVMPAFYYFTAGPHAQRNASEFGRQIADLVKRHGGGNRRLAIDRLSHIGVDALRNQGLEVHDGLEVMEIAREVKSEAELTLMRASMAVCDAGMAAMRTALTPGITENALWAKLHETNIRLGGEWIETRLLSSGPRTNPWFRECSMRPIEAGDMVSFDTDLIGPYGYCSDVSRAWVCGDKPSDEQRRLYGLAYEQIRHNLALLKPGASFREVSERAWPIPEPYRSNRYSSLIHGVGLADEYPSIKHWTDYGRKGYDGEIKAGMTLCVESFIGTQGGREGVKLEEQVIIGDNGPLPMSSHAYETHWL